MANLSVNSKNKISIEKKPRVYFTCHPDDFEAHFERICNDIFKTHDCAVYYTEDMTEKFAADEKEVDLGRNNMFVVPVTYRLISTPNRAMDEDIPYALARNIPVLPIIMEPGLDKFYSSPGKFGELQYINPFSSDRTEISYEEKLKKFLESVLLGDEMIKRIRDAFDAYIFLSYRKKDRKYANDLMRLIHGRSECYDIAVWFDEFLTPGESFKENIEKALSDCKLFTLLVTPRLFEKVTDENGKEQDNYVISTELPIALKNKAEKGTDVFAVEMEKTDENSLFAFNIDNCVNVESDEFGSRLSDSLSGIIKSDNDTPEHKYLIGLAYLDGIDVEVDRARGIALITEAAEAGCLEAMQKLYDIYINGIGVRVDYKRAVSLAEAIVGSMYQKFGEDHTDTLYAMNELAVVYGKLEKHKEALEVFLHISELQSKAPEKHYSNICVTLNNIATEYAELGEYEKALEIHKKVYELHCQAFGKDNYTAVAMLSNLATSYHDAGDNVTAIEYLEQAYELLCNNYGEDHNMAPILANNIAMCYMNINEDSKAFLLLERAYRLQVEKNGEEHPSALEILKNLGLVCDKLKKYKHAKMYLQKSYELRTKVLGYEHPDTIRTLMNFAYAQKECGEYKSALRLYEKAYNLACKAWGKDTPETAIAFRELASLYGKVGDHKKALAFKEKAYNQHCRVFGKEDHNTLIAMNNLAHTYCELGDYRKALKLQEELYILTCKVLGEKDSLTLTIMNNLAGTLYELGKKKKAVEMMEKMCEIKCRVLGKDHPDTIDALENLATCYKLTGDLHKAMDVLKMINKLP